MATFGPIASGNPNALFDPAAMDRAAQSTQRNALMQQHAQEDQAFQREDRRQAVFTRDRTLAGQLAGAVLARPKEERAALYATGIAEYQKQGLLPHAPAVYPGDEHAQRIYDMTLTPAQLEERAGRQDTRQALDARYPMPGSSAPAPAAPQATTAGPAAPADLMPHFEAASRETGIPVPLLVAQAQQESGFRPDAVGRSGEGGVMQIMPATARDPGFGMQGVDPATLRDPAANIMFGARYLAARSPGTDWNDPAARDAALRRYNGGGDPNYAANVTRNLPQPTPPGGVAQRTGGTDVAGPGAGPAAPQVGPSGFTQQQETQLAQAARMRGTTQQQMLQLEHTFRTENAAAQRHRETIEQRRAEHPPADPTAAFGGTGIEAQANNILLKVGPKIADGSATNAERQQYELAHGHITRGSVQPVPDPTDPTGQRMMLGRVPGQVPASFPAPDFRPGAAPTAPASAQPIPGTAKSVAPKEVPAKVADGMLENVGAVRKIDDALLELTTRKDEGVGFVVGNLPTAITSRTDPGGVKLRALIADIGSLKLHDRSGANVTASESPRLLPFIPLTSDNADTVRTKLQNFRREYLTALKDQYETYGPTTGHKAMTPVERLLEGAGGGDNTGGGWSIRPVQ